MRRQAREGSQRTRERDGLVEVSSASTYKRVITNEYIKNSNQTSAD